MPIEFNLPDLGENIEGGDIIAVLVSQGDTITVDQPIVELETDKAVIEVPSAVAGTITQLHVSQGDHVNVGQILITVEAEEGPAETISADAPAAALAPTAAAVPEPTSEPPPAAAAPSAAPLEFNLPNLGENIEGGDVIAVLVSQGDTITVDQPVIELETDKAVIEVPSAVAGTITQLHVSQGDHVNVGQPLITVEAEAGATAVAATPAPATEPQPAATAPTPAPAPAPAAPLPTPTAPVPTDGKAKKTVPAAPSVRRLAREIGIDITQVSGSGPGGRISTDDVKAHSRQLNQQRPAAGGPTTAQQPLPDFSLWGETERQPMTRVRQITAERLTHSWTTIPHVTQFDSADTTEIDRLRKQFAAQAEKAGGKLTPTAILLKVLAAALKVFPQFNASIDMAGHEIIYKKYYNIGIAVDTPHGLLVPVVRDVDQKNIVELSVELTEMAQKTRERKVKPDEMQGGCITISNVGVIGGTGFTPIVNPPEVAIVGVARSRIEAVHIDGEFKPRMMMPLSLSYDHRVIDGADGARFLRWVCEAMENPFKLLVEG
jgi:pyruvate dehydrogenase E2 component (dihydrolipoamide acetyltransferase)